LLPVSGQSPGCLAPRTGIALLLVWQGRVLVGQRIKPPQAGHWQLPGGWVRCGETPEQAVFRQLAGFPAIQSEAPRFVTYSNNLFEQGLHSVTLYFEAACDRVPGDGALQENRRCRNWKWVDWSGLPEPLFLPLANLRASGHVPG
jgi:8-oxo-dGTP diphosphatase